jgi:hypothetical protein
LLRVRYWALDDAGRRVELLATVDQGSDGAFAQVFTDDARDIDAVLELRDGDEWREVRARRAPGGTPRVLPGP